ncbi:MAG: c-type cytochrome [Psychroflexus halocasei]|uniref:c-type cytochrome n=1 Tax=Psychroflexus sp. S27 TaxID=1982757 RepID=UPI000C2AE3AF|nr:c-type cytochrome [Psychroflexus sp. S27]PJX22698.1 cytochrome C [Psychroflexus sp. S27]
MRKVTLNQGILKYFLLSILIFSLSSTYAQEDEASAGSTESAIPGADPVAGKDLFNSLCAACHKPYKDGVGPALHGVTERRDMEWLYKWIKNSQELIASGDSEAVAVYNEWNKVSMNAFPQLSNEDIDDILAYVEQPKPEPKKKEADAGAAVAEGGGGSGISNEVIIGVLAFVLLMLAVILYLVNKTLRKFAEVNGVEVEEKKEKGKPIWVAFAENQFLIIVTVSVMLLVVTWFGYGALMNVGIDQGYEPIQPIHYSHRIHAGDNQIECKYCHSSARKSKHSGIPSLNTCMNCHQQIGEVAEETATEEYSKEFYDGEIQKLYDAVGWDPSTQSYTGETKPVKWVRIHNLPDFAYFNHSQHVSVGQIECQTCHGPVEEMEIMYQDAPLTMGWCINCHRETNVKMEGNAYYEKIHEELAKKYGVEKVTAAQMGGIECGKCHY